MQGTSYIMCGHCPYECTRFKGLIKINKNNHLLNFVMGNKKKNSLSIELKH